jgi:hypothetical protein
MYANLDLPLELTGGAAALVLGYILLDVRPEGVLRAGDQVILYGPSRELAPLLSGGGEGERELRSATWLYRLARWRGAPPRRWT